MNIRLLALVTLTSACAHAQTSIPPQRALTFGHLEIDCHMAPDRRVDGCRAIRASPPSAIGTDFLSILGPNYRTPDDVAKTARNGRVLIQIPLQLVPMPR